MGRPFLAYIILPVWPGPLSLLSQGRVHTKPRHWIHAWAGSNMRVALRSRHILHMATIYAKTYIQPIVLQEGVYTIRHFA